MPRPAQNHSAGIWVGRNVAPVEHCADSLSPESFSITVAERVGREYVGVPCREVAATINACSAEGKHFGSLAVNTRYYIRRLSSLPPTEEGSFWAFVSIHDALYNHFGLVPSALRMFVCLPQSTVLQCLAHQTSYVGLRAMLARLGLNWLVHLAPHFWHAEVFYEAVPNASRFLRMCNAQQSRCAIPTQEHIGIEPWEHVTLGLHLARLTKVARQEFHIVGRFPVVAELCLTLPSLRFLAFWMSESLHLGRRTDFLANAHHYLSSPDAHHDPETSCQALVVIANFVVVFFSSYGDDITDDSNDVTEGSDNYVQVLIALLMSHRFDEALFFQAFQVTPSTLLYHISQKFFRGALILHPADCRPSPGLWKCRMDFRNTSFVLASRQIQQRSLLTSTIANSLGVTCQPKRSPLCSSANKVSTVFDIGIGHRPLDTLYFLGQGHRVIAVDANPLAFEELQHLEGDDLVLRHRVIVGSAQSANDHRAFFVNLQRGSHSFAPAEHHGGLPKGHREVRVASMRCGDMVHEFGIPDYLKVDVEGRDILCVESFLDTMPNPAPKRVYLSFTADFAWLANNTHKLEAAGWTHGKAVCQSLHCLAPPRAACGSGPMGEHALDAVTGFKWRRIRSLVRDTQAYAAFTRRGIDWLDLHLKNEGAAHVNVGGIASV